MEDKLETPISEAIIGFEESMTEFDDFDQGSSAAPHKKRNKREAHELDRSSGDDSITSISLYRILTSFIKSNVCRLNYS